MKKLYCPGHADHPRNESAEQQKLGRCWQCGNRMVKPEEE